MHRLVLDLTILVSKNYAYNLQATERQRKERGVDVALIQYNDNVMILFQMVLRGCVHNDPLP